MVINNILKACILLDKQIERYDIKLKSNWARLNAE